eukprot:364869-Amphidinium_carterae.2
MIEKQSFQQPTQGTAMGLEVNAFGIEGTSHTCRPLRSSVALFLHVCFYFTSETGSGQHRKNPALREAWVNVRRALISTIIQKGALDLVIWDDKDIVVSDYGVSLGNPAAQTFKLVIENPDTLMLRWPPVPEPSPQTMSLFGFDVGNSANVSLEYFLDHVWSHPKQKAAWLWAQIAHGLALSFEDTMCSQVNLLSEGQALQTPPVQVLQPTRKRRLAQRLHKFKVKAQLRLAQRSDPAETCLRYYSNILLLTKGCKRATIACDASRVAGKGRLVAAFCIDGHLCWAPPQARH